jgi:hypothetical protein
MTFSQSQVLLIFLYKDTPGRVKDCQKTLYAVLSVATPQIQNKANMPKKGDSKPKAEAVSFFYKINLTVTCILKKKTFKVVNL